MFGTLVARDGQRDERYVETGNPLKYFQSDPFPLMIQHPLQGSALRKGPRSRKVDKCGTVFGEGDEV